MFPASGLPIGSLIPAQEANSSQRSAVLGGSKHDQAGQIANLHQRAPCYRPRFRNMDRGALLEWRRVDSGPDFPNKQSHEPRRALCFPFTVDILCPDSR